MTNGKTPLRVQPIPGTPPELFAALRRRTFPFWLDSAGGPAEVARWSFMGADPVALFDVQGGEAVWFEGDRRETMEGDPLEAFRSKLERFALPPAPEGSPFVGGAAGWLSYDLARSWDPLPELACDDAGLPEMRMAIYPLVFAYDHRRSQLYRIDRDDLRLPPLRLPENSRKRVVPACTLAKPDYRRAVRKIQAYIAAGDIYQANLTRRVAAPLHGDPAERYLRLRTKNPAPFAAYLGFGEIKILSASPERFLSLDAFARRAETRPIKGTRPRSADPEEDLRFAAELLRSEKDRAENLMIVDVHRNDLGRVCEIGSVKTPTLWGLESYATVHHLVSVVEGRLPETLGPADLIRAAFPAGSITGAPKLRAREVIEELEPARRGVYTGSIGYIGWDGGMDLSVAIRTLIVQDGWIHYGVGGGIVADSDPDAEYRETLDKAKGLQDSPKEAER
jgi:para-aminobenzoate synthetase component 1